VKEAKENSMVGFAMRQVVRDCQAEGMTRSETEALLLKYWMEESLLRCKNNQTVLAEREHLHRNTITRMLRRSGIVPVKGWKISRHVNA
jgi:hypothetical protein